MTLDPDVNLTYFVGQLGFLEKSLGQVHLGVGRKFFHEFFGIEIFIYF